MAAGSLENLPDDAQKEILCRLPTTDAARMSVLSRSWLNGWKSIPDIDLSFLPIAAVDEALRLHSVPLRRLKLHHIINNSKIAGSPASGDADVLDPSVSSAVASSLASIAPRSSASLRALDLSCSFSLSLCVVGSRFPNLTVIKLSHGFIVELEPGAILPNLKTLDLKCIRFPYIIDDLLLSDISTFIPICPMLETLAVYLTVSHRTFPWDLSSIARDFPRLTHLRDSGSRTCFV